MPRLNIDIPYLRERLEALLAIPSPSGYTDVVVRHMCEQLSALGFEELSFLELPEQLRNHYATVRRSLEARKDEMLERSGADYVARMLEGLGHWVEAADRGHLTWGILHFRLAQ